jgi:hypothetical protein
MRRRLRPVLVTLIVAFVAGAAYLYLDYEGLVPWARIEDPVDLGPPQPAPEADRRVMLVTRKVELEEAIAIRKRRGLPVEAAETLLTTGCVRFAEGRLTDAETAFSEAFQVLQGPQAGPAATPTAAPGPTTSPVPAKRRQEFEDRLKAVQAALDAHPKDCPEKDALYEDLASALQLLDRGDLRVLEGKVDDLEYGVARLPQ